jgi:hypothetical protein
VTLRFVDGTEERAAELRRILPALVFELHGLPVGYATSAPDPQTRARDMVLAMDDHDASFAEATDLTTMEGKSLRLELDTDNSTRFCRWFRETPSRLHVCVALRRAGGAIELFGAECEGVIADAPAGPVHLGWDRLFVPSGFTKTMAELALAASTASDPDPVGLRTLVYGDLAAALGIS